MHLVFRRVRAYLGCAVCVRIVHVAIVQKTGRLQQRGGQTVWKGKHKRGKCLEGYSQGISSLTISSLFFFIFDHWVGLVFFSTLIFITKTEIKINVLLC